MAFNPGVESWTLVFDAMPRGIKPPPSRPPKRTRKRIKNSLNDSL